MAPEDIWHKHVLGYLRLWLAALATLVTCWPLAAPPDRELNREELRRARGELITYRVLCHAWHPIQPARRNHA